MSDILKVVLVFLFAGSVGSLVCRGRQNLRRWWNEPGWLFCDAAAELREQAADWLAIGFILVIYFFEVPQILICALGGVSEEAVLWEIAEKALLCLFFVGKAMFATRYSGKQLLVLWACIGYFSVLVMVSGYGTLGKAMMLMIIAKDADLKKCVKAAGISMAIHVIVNGILSTTGLIGMIVEDWDHQRPRYDFGFGSVNALGVMVAEAAIAYLLFRFDKLKWWDVAVGLAALVFIDVVPNSRGSMLLLILAMVGLMAAKLVPALFRKLPVQLICSAPAVALSALFWWLHFNYDYNNPSGFWYKMDQLLTGRISLSAIAHHKLFKHPNPMPFWGQIFNRNYIYRVDNTYIYYGYICGPLMAILIVVCFVYLTMKLLRRGRLELAAVVVAYSCYAAMERCLSSINLSLLFMPVILFGAGSLKWPDTSGKSSCEVKGKSQ